MSAFDKLDLKINGGSHTEYIEVSIEGLPQGFAPDEKKLQLFLDRRKSGKYAHSTPRREEDRIEIVSGLQDGKICGAFCARIKNENVKQSDYRFDDVPRPSHADYVSKIKYGHALSGGGPFSGRMTAALCIAGGIAKQYLASRGVTVCAYISEIGGIVCRTYDNGIPNEQEIVDCYNYAYPTPDREKLPAIEKRLNELADRGDTAGGSIECVVFHSPVGVGGPLFEGLEGKVAAALFAVPAVKAVESGLGKNFADKTGLTANDPFVAEGGEVKTKTNFSGGINGGITNGMPVTFRATFRPTPSVAAPQKTANIATGETTDLVIGGRHDVAFLPRAVAVVESAVSLAYLDAALCAGLL